MCNENHSNKGSLLESIACPNTVTNKSDSLHSFPSIEYWFRCMDLDGDGMLSMYELEYFYEEQCERMESMGIEPLPFHDLLCQMLDLVKPECDGKTHLYNALSTLLTS